MSNMHYDTHRLCAGRHLAESALWIEAAGLLAAFTIEHEKDENGNEIDVSYAATPGPEFVLWVYFPLPDKIARRTQSFPLYRHPPTFPCVFTLRSQNVATVIRDTANY